MDKEQKLTLTVDEVAARLGISRALAYASVKTGQIPSIRIGKRYLVPKIKLDKILER